MKPLTKKIVKTRNAIATVQCRRTDNIFSVHRVDDETLILFNDNEEIQVPIDELFDRDNYIVLEGFIGIRAHGENWIFCCPDDDMHEIRHIRDGRAVTFSGEPIGRMQDYIHIRIGRV